MIIMHSSRDRTLESAIQQMIEPEEEWRAVQPAGDTSIPDAQSTNTQDSTHTALQQIGVQAAQFAINLTQDAYVRMNAVQDLNFFSQFTPVYEDEHIRISTGDGNFIEHTVRDNPAQSRYRWMEGVYEGRLTVLNRELSPLGRIFNPAPVPGSTLNMFRFPRILDALSPPHFDYRTALIELNNEFHQLAHISPRLITNLNRAGMGLMAVSAGTVAYNIATSENQIETAIDEAPPLVCGIGGGYAGGTLGGALASSLVCGEGAPLCALAIVVPSMLLGGWGGSEGGNYLSGVLHERRHEENNSRFIITTSYNNRALCPPRSGETLSLYDVNDIFSVTNNQCLPVTSINTLTSLEHSPIAHEIVANFTSSLAHQENELVSMNTSIGISFGRTHPDPLTAFTNGMYYGTTDYRLALRGRELFSQFSNYLLQQYNRLHVLSSAVQTINELENEEWEAIELIADTRLADTNSSSFSNPINTTSPTYTAGNLFEQDSVSVTGPFDHSVQNTVNSFSLTLNSGIGSSLGVTPQTSSGTTSIHGQTPSSTRQFDSPLISSPVTLPSFSYTAGDFWNNRTTGDTTASPTLNPAIQNADNSHNITVSTNLGSHLRDVSSREISTIPSTSSTTSSHSYSQMLTALSVSPSRSDSNLQNVSQQSLVSTTSTTHIVGGSPLSVNTPFQEALAAFGVHVENFSARQVLASSNRPSRETFQSLREPNSALAQLNQTTAVTNYSLNAPFITADSTCADLWNATNEHQDALTLAYNHQQSQCNSLSALNCSLSPGFFSGYQLNASGEYSKKPEPPSSGGHNHGSGGSSERSGGGESHWSSTGVEGAADYSCDYGGGGYAYC